MTVASSLIRVRTLTFLYAVFVLGASAETPPEIRDLVRKSLSGLNSEDERRRDWVYAMRQDRKEFDSSRKLKSHSSFVIRKEWVDGIQVTRSIERDGKPVSEDMKKIEDDQIKARVAELKNLTPEQRRAQQEQGSRRDKEQDAWIQEFPEALDYRPAGEEMVNGRPALLFDCSPRPGYRSRNLRARVFEKMRGRVWIDKAESEMVKADAETFETVTIGFGIIGRIEKGTRFSLTRRRVADRIWFTDSQFLKFDVKYLIVKSMHREVRWEQYDFRPRPAVQAVAGR